MGGKHKGSKPIKFEQAGVYISSLPPVALVLPFRCRREIYLFMFWLLIMD